MIKHVCISKQTQKSNNHHTKHIKRRSKRAHYFEKKTNFINRTLHSAKCKVQIQISFIHTKNRSNKILPPWAKVKKDVKKTKLTLHYTTQKMSSRFGLPPFYSKTKLKSLLFSASTSDYITKAIYKLKTLTLLPFFSYSTEPTFL